MFHVAAISNLEWDKQVDEAGAWAPHNYSGWAELKKLDGWKPLRIIDAERHPVAQVLTKTICGKFTIAYAPGGFLTNFNVDAGVLTTFLADHLKSTMLYCRIHMLTPTRLKELALEQAHWKRSHSAMSSGESLKLRLDSTIEQRESLLSFNWRRNLRRGQKHDNVVELVRNPSSDEIVSTHLELERLKGNLVNTWESSTRHVDAALSGFGKQLVLVRCTSPDGVLRSIRGAVVTGGGTSAYDFLAATTEDGRKHYSSYVTLWHLANELSRRGVLRYDLGGVDRLDNKGVFDFKNGTGAVPISYGGEFDFTNPRLMRPLVSRLVYWIT